MDTLTFRQPRIVALALLVIVAGGLSALLSIGRQEDPTITNLFATVTTVFPGADPERVETLVTAEIEDVLREVPEVSVIDSATTTGVSIVSIELSDRLADDRIEQVWSEIRDALDDAAQTFPAGVQPPEFSSDGAGAYAAIVTLSAAHEGVPLTLMGRYGEELAATLRNVTGTKLVDTFGAPEEEVLVRIDPVMAAARGLSADAISGAIRAADSKGQAGRLRGSDSDLIINVTGEVTALDRLREVVLQSSADGPQTTLGDIAEITRGPRLPLAERALHDGAPAVLVAAKLEDGLQVDIWAADLRGKLTEFERDLPGGITLDLSFDQSVYTAERLWGVLQNMALGIVLVVAVLFLTLGPRAALLVAMILPIVTLATLTTMNIIGLPIHQMSVSGLIVALGLLVDAGIVMTDEVRRRLQEGAARIVAVGQSVRRLAAPLFASTVTTVLSFTPLILLPGPAGDFVGSIAIAVVTMLIWSFVVAVTITPALAGWIMPDSENRGLFSRGIPGGFVARGFAWTLGWAVRNPVRGIALAMVLPITGFMSLPHLTAQFFPGTDRDQFHIELDMAPGSALAQTETVVTRLDAALRADARILSVSWVMGRSAPAFYYNMVGGRDNAPGFAQALVRTTSPQTTEAILPELQRSLPALAPEAQVLVRGLTQGPPVSAPVELRIVGTDLAVLREEGERLRAIVDRVDVITLARSTVGAAAPKLSVEADEVKARALGLDLGGIARQLEAGLEGVTGGSMLEGSEQLPIRVRLGDGVRSDMAAIADLPILPPNAAALAAQGRYPALLLSAVADVVLEPSASAITRRNSERVNTVQGFVLRGVLPSEALAQVQAAMAEEGFALPPGYRLELGGDSDARSDTVNNLIASLGLIVTLSIATIVMTFNSFRLSAITLVVCGLAAGLSILSLAIFQYPFGISAIVGLTGSIGVSINAAIIVLTGLRDDADARSGDTQAMVDVVMRSSRHIVSTTITTFGGFLPLILAGGGFWPPFAMAVAGGVAFSTVVSFYFTPPMFALIYARKGRAKAEAAPENASEQGVLRLSPPMATAAE